MDLAARFRTIIERLCHAVALRGAEKKFGPDGGAIVLLLWARLHRAMTRFSSLAAGAPLPRPRASRPRGNHPRAPDLPRRRGWILGPVPEAAATAGHLRAFLADQAVAALAAADPRIARILRPLCRTLGLAPPAWLRRPRPKRPPASPKPRRPRAPKPDFALAGDLPNPLERTAPLWLVRRPRGPVARAKPDIGPVARAMPTTGPPATA